MASSTKRTRHIRRRKKNTQGKVRKRENVNHGTTRTKAELFGDSKD